MLKIKAKLKNSYSKMEQRLSFNKFTSFCFDESFNIFHLHVCSFLLNSLTENGRQNALLAFGAIQKDMEIH